MFIKSNSQNKGMEDQTEKSNIEVQEPIKTTKTTGHSAPKETNNNKETQETHHSNQSEQHHKPHHPKIAHNIPHKTENITNKTTSSKSLKDKAITFKGKLPSWIKNPYNLLFLVIIGFTLVTRLRFFPMESLWNDAAVHLWYAIKVTQDPLFVFSQQYLLGDYLTVQSIWTIVYVFVRDVFIAAKLVALAYTLAAITLAYLVGSKLKNKTTGLIAAALLTVNHIYWFYSTKILADGPLLTWVLLLTYAMLLLEEKKELKYGILSAIAVLAVLFTKNQAVIILLAYFLYFALFKRKEAWTNKAYRIAWIIPLGLLLLAQLVATFFLNARLLDRVFELFLTTRGMPYGLEALGQLQWMLSWYTIIPAIIGLFFIIAYRYKKYYFSLVLIISYYLFFEINVDQTSDRYLLSLLPLILLISAFAIDEIGAYLAKFSWKEVRPIVAVIAVLFIAAQLYPVGEELVYNKSFGFTGFPEAGDYLIEQMGEDDLLFAGSPRMIRAFVEKEWHDDGTYNSPEMDGPVYWLRGERYHEDYNREGLTYNEDAQSNFETDIAELSVDHTIWLEIDIWEYTQPAWYYPLTQDSLDYFSSLGFELVNVVVRDVSSEEGSQESGVIFIFVLEQGTYQEPAETS